MSARIFEESLLPAELTPLRRPGPAVPALARAYERTLDCVHCGLCLPDCPTYRASGDEARSPRGRILLVRALAEARLPAQDRSARHALGDCLQCRACESACPSGVRYGALFAEAAAALQPARLGARLTARLLDLFVAGRSGRRAALAAGRALRALRLTALGRILPAPRLRAACALLEAAPRPAPGPRPGRYEPDGPARGEAALFTGCIQNDLFGAVNQAALACLRRAGYRITVPPGQGCCGALHLHQGFEEKARRLLARNDAAFAATRGPIVTTAAGCGAMLREAQALLPDSRLAARTRDFSEVMAEIEDLRFAQPVAARAVWAPPCHLAHAQGVRRAPRALLARIPGLELVPCDRPEDCCGSGGIHNLLAPASAAPVLARRLDDLLEASPDLVITANPGCHLQLAAGLRARRARAEVRHLAEILSAALGLSSPPLRRPA